MKIPAQYLPVMPYLILPGAREFLTFAKAVFGATEQLLVPTEQDQIQHGEIRIGEAVIMFGEAGEQWKKQTAAMYLYVPDVNQVYKAALDQGAKSLDAPQQREYGYTGGFEDPFGNQWFVVEPPKEI